MDRKARRVVDHIYADYPKGKSLDLQMQYKDVAETMIEDLVEAECGRRLAGFAERVKATASFSDVLGREVVELFPEEIDALLAGKGSE